MPSYSTAKVTLFSHQCCRYKDKQKKRLTPYRGMKKIKMVIFLYQSFYNLKQTSPILKNLIAERMRCIREQCDHTQEYVANNTHLKIWDYESGQKSPTLESIAKFCEFYKISLREFFDIDSFDYPLKK